MRPLKRGFSDMSGSKHSLEGVSKFFERIFRVPGPLSVDCSCLRLLSANFPRVGLLISGFHYSGLCLDNSSCPGSHWARVYEKPSAQSWLLVSRS